MRDTFKKLSRKDYQITRVIFCVSLCLTLFLNGCMIPKQPEIYYGQINVPQKQELRWSNGGLPKIFDPTFAAVPPDTDAVRAIYEGLTDFDPVTLKPVPAVAFKWQSSVDGREWIFYLRQNALWSNGDTVTANDFVHSWQRVLDNREKSPHAKLMANIVGAFDLKEEKVPTKLPDPFKTPPPIYQTQQTEESKDEKTLAKANKFSVEAVNDFELRVRLIHPDPDFPSLVTHPVFRPIHQSLLKTNTPISSDDVVTNGAFELTKNGQDGVLIERAKNYWDAKAVNLNKVLFVPGNDIESNLTAYKNGEVDAVTNARFEPLGLKLLEPYKDFRKVPYGAVTFYRFNTTRKPFDDIRVREALAIALDRERINTDTLDGASKPADSFLPYQGANSSSKRGNAPKKLELNIERAKELLEEAGFPLGVGFPKIKLLVNRNDQQKQVANAVSEMWKRELNIETEIIIKPWDEYEKAIISGDYDIVRRGMVMQTADETSNMLAMFEPLSNSPITQEENDKTLSNSPSKQNINPNSKEPNNNGQVKQNSLNLILSEQQALKELPAIPIYFSNSYSLVKPYILGFDSNLLDAPSLKQVRIKTDWKAEIKPTPTNQKTTQ